MIVLTLVNHPDLLHEFLDEFADARNHARASLTRSGARS